MRNFFCYSLDAYYLFKHNLVENEVINKPELPEGYSKIVIELSDDPYIGKLISFWEKAYGVKRTKAESDVISSIESGDVCCLATFQGEIAAMCWSGNHSTKRIALSKVLEHEKNIGIGYNHFVDSQHRGKKLQRILTLYTFDYAQKSGAQTYYAFVGVKNFPSIVTLQKIFSECKIVHHLEVEVPFVKLHFYPAFTKENWQKYHH